MKRRKNWEESSIIAGELTQSTKRDEFKLGVGMERRCLIRPDSNLYFVKETRGDILSFVKSE